ncbi:uncharacterized protein LOC107495148 [Arachis duranensis]|uniref:Uncharacterized protein LOC107495148 n=1 Tax=Arachis duranensis TaxID=130453 RepID=A0A6P4DPG5_ARADU|nr:uncharacterized protein LOC107495148 [Arachis duranensis]
MATFFHLSKSLSSPLPFFRIPPPLRRKHRPSTVAPARAGPSSSSIAFAIGLPLSLLAVTVLTSLRIANKLDQQFFEEMAMNEAIMQADEDDDDDYEDEDYYDDDDDDDDDAETSVQQEPALPRSRNRPIREA